MASGSWSGPGHSEQQAAWLAFKDHGAHLRMATRLALCGEGGLAGVPAGTAHVSACQAPRLVAERGCGVQASDAPGHVGAAAPPPHVWGPRGCAHRGIASLQEQEVDPSQPPQCPLPQLLIKWYEYLMANY